MFLPKYRRNVSAGVSAGVSAEGFCRGFLQRFLQGVSAEASAGGFCTGCLQGVYAGSFRSEANLAQFPAGEEIEMQAEEISPEIAGQLHVERRLFCAWLDGAESRDGQVANQCGGALLFFATNAKREDMRGAATGDAAFEVCYRHMCMSRCAIDA